MAKQKKNIDIWRQKRKRMYKWIFLCFLSAIPFLIAATCILLWIHTFSPQTFSNQNSTSQLNDLPYLPGSAREHLTGPKKTGVPELVVLGRNSCHHCRRQTIIIKEIASRGDADITISKIDFDDDRTKPLLNIEQINNFYKTDEGVPVLALFNQTGELIARHDGRLFHRELIEFLRNHLKAPVLSRAWQDIVESASKNVQTQDDAIWTYRNVLDLNMSLSSLSEPHLNFGLADSPNIIALFIAEDAISKNITEMYSSICLDATCPLQFKVYVSNEKNSPIFEQWGINQFPSIAWASKDNRIHRIALGAWNINNMSAVFNALNITSNPLDETGKDTDCESNVNDTLKESPGKRSKCQ